MINFWQKLTKPFTVLAPVENVTDFCFREIVSINLVKPDVLFTEFTNVDALNSPGFDRNDTKAYSQKEYKEVLLKHLSLLSPDQNYGSIKKFFKMYVNNFKGASNLRVKLMATKSVSDAQNLLR